MSIYLVRHGETELNVARTLQPADTPLSERGLAQARSVAQRLATERIVAVVSSDLPRAARTAEAIANACGLSILWEPLLQERNFGDLRGCAYDTLGFDPLQLVEAPPGGESEAEFRTRVAQAFARVVALREGLDGNLAVVTHGLVIAELLSSHVQLPPGTALPGRLGNTSLTVIDPTSPHAVGLLDCMRHLEGSVREDPNSLSGG